MARQLKFISLESRLDMYEDKHLKNIELLEELINKALSNTRNEDDIHNIKKHIDQLKRYNGRCQYCGNPLILKNPNVKNYRKFCDQVCKQRYKAYFEKIEERCSKFGTKTIDYNLTPPIIYKAYNGKCQYCGKQVKTQGSRFDDDYMNIDHIRPLSDGGGHAWVNLTLSCRKCNMKKGTKSRADFLNNRGYFYNTVSYR